METARIPLRSEVPFERTWSTESVFASEAEWEAAMADIEARLPAVAAFAGRLAEGPGMLADFVSTSEALRRDLGRALIYAENHHAVDTADARAKARHDRAIALYARVQATMAFAEPELLTIPPHVLARWLAEEPRLTHLAHYIDALERRRPHVRAAEVEALLGEVGAPFATASATHSVLADADLRFRPAVRASGERVEVSQGNIDALLTSADRTLRRTAFEAYADAYLAHRHSMANCLMAGVQQNVFLARARRYPSALEAALGANHVPVEVFHQTIATFQRHLPIWHRLWRLKRRLLGYEALHAYDLPAPLATVAYPVPWEQAVEWVCAGLQPLGEDYVATARRGLGEERWVDALPNQNKHGGAYSSGQPGTRPFILMSYTDDVYSLSTLAHELGHSLHSHHVWTSQPLMYCDYPIFAAEVASNLNQAMVRDHLLATEDDPALHLALVEEALANFYRYYLLMPTLARLELAIHERVEAGEALSHELLSDLTVSLFAEALGGEVEVDAPRVGITWAQFPAHLYAGFYVYQYTTGIAAAHALLERIQAGEADAVPRYLTCLRDGASRYPLDSLRAAGVDMASPEPVERAFGYLAGLVDRLAELAPAPKDGGR